MAKETARDDRRKDSVGSESNENSDAQPIQMSVSENVTKTERDVESENTKVEQNIPNKTEPAANTNLNENGSHSKSETENESDLRIETSQSKEIRRKEEIPSVGNLNITDTNQNININMTDAEYKKTLPNGLRVNMNPNDNAGGRREEKESTKERCFKDSGEALELALMQLGPFGFYQRVALILLCIPNLFSAMYSLNYVFVADQVPFRCIVPECELGGSFFGNETVQELLLDDKCRRLKPLEPDQVTCARDNYHENISIECNGYLYENMETTYAEFGMACNEWQRTLVGTVRNTALPFALILTGYVSDGWGRRTAFCIFSACAGIMGIVKSFVPHYRLYLVMEFFEAALGYGFNSAAYVMMVELARPSLRAAFACATGVAYGLGGVLFALIASRVRYWRHLLRTIHTPALLLPIYWLLIDESTRWLHATKRNDRAVANIRKAARWNKIPVDEDLMTAINDDSTRKEEVKSDGNPWLSLIKSRVLMLRFAVCCWCWISAAFVYYGLTINSVSLSGDKYTNFALNMAMEIVASLLIMMSLERFGRKRSIFVAFLICGIVSIIPYFVSHSGAGLALFFVGKLTITFAFNSLYVFTAELFPTSVRSSALAASSLVGRIGSVLAPQTPLLSVYVQALLYGACSVSAALLVLLAPETRRAPLPQYVRHAERLRPPEPALHVPPASRQRD